MVCCRRRLESRRHRHQKKVDKSGRRGEPLRDCSSSHLDKKKWNRKNWYCKGSLEEAG